LDRQYQLTSKNFAINVDSLFLMYDLKCGMFL